MKHLVFALALLMLTPHSALAGPRAPLRTKSPAQALIEGPKPAASEIAYFRNLLARAETAPIEDFFHLWFPNDVKTVEQSYLDTCVNYDRNEMLREADGTLSQACKPDVLYSWGPEIKLTNLRKDLVDGASWNKTVNGGRRVWMTISPISTYSYGLIPIRFKFKPQVKFTNEASDQTVWEHTGELMDFVFDNASVLESWSVGRPEHYDEIVKDIRQFGKSLKTLTYSGHIGTEPDTRNVYIAGVVEREAQNEETLRQRLTFMIKMILENKGEVHFARGVVPSVEKHFATDHPTYFNER